MNEMRHAEVKEIAPKCLLLGEELASLLINILCHLFAVGKLENRRITLFQDRRFMLLSFLLSRPTEGSQ